MDSVAELSRPYAGVSQKGALIKRGLVPASGPPVAEPVVPADTASTVTTAGEGKVDGGEVDGTAESVLDRSGDAGSNETENSGTGSPEQTPLNPENVRRLVISAGIDQERRERFNNDFKGVVDWLQGQMDAGVKLSEDMATALSESRYLDKPPGQDSYDELTGDYIDQSGSKANFNKHAKALINGAGKLMGETENLPEDLQAQYDELQLAVVERNEPGKEGYVVEDRKFGRTTDEAVIAEVCRPLFGEIFEVAMSNSLYNKDFELYSRVLYTWAILNFSTGLPADVRLQIAAETLDLLNKKAGETFGKVSFKEVKRNEEKEVATTSNFTKANSEVRLRHYENVKSRQGNDPIIERMLDRMKSHAVKVGGKLVSEDEENVRKMLLAHKGNGLALITDAESAVFGQQNMQEGFMGRFLQGLGLNNYAALLQTPIVRELVQSGQIEFLKQLSRDAFGEQGMLNRDLLNRVQKAYGADNFMKVMKREYKKSMQDKMISWGVPLMLLWSTIAPLMDDESSGPA